MSNFYYHTRLFKSPKGSAYDKVLCDLCKETTLRANYSRHKKTNPRHLKALQKQEFVIDKTFTGKGQGLADEKTEEEEEENSTDEEIEEQIQHPNYEGEYTPTYNYEYNNQSNNLNRVRTITYPTIEPIPITNNNYIINGVDYNKPTTFTYMTLNSPYDEIIKSIFKYRHYYLEKQYLTEDDILSLQHFIYNRAVFSVNRINRMVNIYKIAN
jgi:hypothetical protein